MPTIPPAHSSVPRTRPPAREPSDRITQGCQREKGKILSVQINPTRLFEPAISEIQTRFKSKKKETEVLGTLLPRKQAPKPTFSQVVTMRPPSQNGRIPKKPQQLSQTTPTQGQTQSAHQQCSASGHRRPPKQRAAEILSAPSGGNGKKRHT